MPRIPLLALPLLALPLLVCLPVMATAETKLTCGFEGNKTIVTIVNPGGDDVQCNYACHYVLEGGSVSLSGSVRVKAGQARIVDEETRRSKVTRVRESSIKCE